MTTADTWDEKTIPIPFETMVELVAMATNDGATPEVVVDPDETPEAPLKPWSGACGRCSQPLRNCCCDWADEPTKENE